MLDCRFISDLSGMGQRNLQINNLNDQRATFLQADVLEWLSQQSGKQQWDIIICDVPTFSNSKRMTTHWQVQENHAWLLWRLWAITAPGGWVYFSNNFRGFKLAEQGLPPFIMEELTPHSIPLDFRNKRIHRCWRCVKPS